ncbi:hypothetical protein PLESTM_001812200 [Pleodorina starrii]|nr:hypothetical protein PLESTM_001812200 [Pleodorina starrii]
MHLLGSRTSGKPPSPPPPSPPSALDLGTGWNPFDIELKPLAYYTIQCALNLNADSATKQAMANRDVVDVSVMTNLAQSFRVQLSTKPPPTAAQISAEARITALEARTLSLEARASALEAQVALLKTQVSTSLDLGSLSVKRLCVGQACLQASSNAGSTSDDGTGRIYFLGKTNGVMSAMIATNTGDGSDRFVLFPTPVPAGSFEFIWPGRGERANYFFINSISYFGVFNRTSKTFPGRLLSDEVCVGDVCQRPTSYSRSKMAFSRMDSALAIGVTVNVDYGVGDILQVFPSKDGGNSGGAYYWYWNKNAQAGYSSGRWWAQTV